MTPTESAGLALVVGVIASFVAAEGVKPAAFLRFQHKSDYVFLTMVIGHMLKTANDAPVRKVVPTLYWPIGMIMCGIAAFGGGFLAPLTVARCPAPLLEETMIWTCMFSWYVTYHMPVVSVKWAELAATWPVQKMLLVIFAVFRTHQQIGCIEIADAGAIDAQGAMNGPTPRFITTPYASMLICGFLGGCGGSFLPFDKGLSALGQGRNFPVTFSLFSTVYYIVATRMLGVEHLDAKMYMAFTRLLCELFPGPREMVFAPIRKTYKYVAMPDACMDKDGQLPK